MRSREKFLAFASAVLALTAFGCTRGTSTVTREPVHPTESGAAVATTRNEPAQLDARDRVQPVYNAQKGWENQLPPPDANTAGGPIQATTSDVGKPRMRGSSGTFIDDPSRYPGLGQRNAARDLNNPANLGIGGGPRDNDTPDTPPATAPEHTNTQSDITQPAPGTDNSIVMPRNDNWRQDESTPPAANTGEPPTER